MTLNAPTISDIAESDHCFDGRKLSGVLRTKTAFTGHKGVPIKK